MPSGFQTPLDIAKRACQHLGVRQITSFSDTTSVASAEFNALYDKIRDRELERNIWRFAIKRVVLRPLTDTSFLWAPPTWDIATDYSAGAIVAYKPITGGSFPTSVETTYWQTDAAVVASSGTQPPDIATNWHRYAGNVSGDDWQATGTSGITTNGYFPGEFVVEAGLVYMSLTTANTDTPPSANWLAMGGSKVTLKIFYPIGTGPAWDLQTANVLRVPYGFERIAPAYLFKNDVAYLGADIGPYNDDWTIEGNYAITQYGSAVMMRFVGDMIDVYDMSAMFCEGVAAEMAWNACERITGSAEKKAACREAYGLYMIEARLVNEIMEGMKKQPVCDYIAVRV